jgi:hypothetical protein
MDRAAGSVDGNVGGRSLQPGGNLSKHGGFMIEVPGFAIDEALDVGHSHPAGDVVNVIELDAVLGRETMRNVGVALEVLETDGRELAAALRFADAGQASEGDGKLGSIQETLGFGS